MKARNRLAGTILAALSDGEARRVLERLASRGPSADDWPEPDEPRDAALLRQRARAAHDALRTRPLITREPILAEALAVAAVLFDAGLHFEVHELLEPHWVRARGEEREVLQGLIQIAVGYQHLANGNHAGARALLSEGSDRVRGRRLRALELTAFAEAVRDSILRAGPVDQTSVPRFPTESR